jgi:hypothetical protein
MNKKKTMIVLASLVAIALIALALQPALTANSVETEENKIKWLFIIYVAADNNIWPALFIPPFLAGLARVGSSEHAKVVILTDGQQGNDTFLLELDGHSVRIVRHMGEMNMGDPTTLRYLIEYSSDSEAEKKVLWMMDHGGGWRGSCREEGQLDDETMDLLTTPEFREALEGYHIDVLIWEACLMQSLEVAYEVKDLVDYIIASEEVTMVSVPNVLETNEDPPHELLKYMNENPDASPLDLVRVYKGMYDPASLGLGIYISQLIGVGQTHSALDMDQIGDLIKSVDDLGKKLNQLLPDKREEIAKARKGAREYTPAPEQYMGLLKAVPIYVDLYSLADKLEIIDDEELIEICEEVKANVENAVIWMENLEITASMKGNPSHGVTINFPRETIGVPIEVYESLAERYSELRFAELSWDEFLDRYMGIDQNPVSVCEEGGEEEYGSDGHYNSYSYAHGSKSEPIAGAIIGAMIGGLVFGSLIGSTLPTIAMILIIAAVALITLLATSPQIGALATYAFWITLIGGAILLIISTLIGVLAALAGTALGYLFTPIWVIAGLAISLVYGIPPEELLNFELVRIYLFLWLNLPIPTYYASVLKAGLGTVMEYGQMLFQGATFDIILSYLEFLPDPVREVFSIITPLEYMWVKLGEILFSAILAISGVIKEIITATSTLISFLMGISADSSARIFSILPFVGDELSTFVREFTLVITDFLERLFDLARWVLP